jgi:hypothetical protein
MNAIALKGIMFVGGRAKELVFLGGVFLTTDAADNHILGMAAALHGVTQGLALGTLLNEGEGLEFLGVDGTTKHEEGGLQDMGGGLAILVKKGKGDGPMAGLSRNVSLKPMGIGEKGDAGAEHITAQLRAQLVRARKGTRLVMNNGDHMEENARITPLGCDSGIRAKKVKEYFLVLHHGSIINLSIEDKDEVGRRLRALSAAYEINGWQVGMGVMLA